MPRLDKLLSYHLCIGRSGASYDIDDYPIPCSERYYKGERQPNPKPPVGQRLLTCSFARDSSTSERTHSFTGTSRGIDDSLLGRATLGCVFGEGVSIMVPPAGFSSPLQRMGGVAAVSRQPSPRLVTQNDRTVILA